MISESKSKVLALFAEGRRHYKMGKFREARGCFAKALAADPNDGPSKEYLKRCDHYVQNPPGEDWDGVFDMKTK